MKKFISVISVLMLLAICGCGKNTEPTIEESSTETIATPDIATETTATINEATPTIAIEDFVGKEIILGAVGDETISNNIVKYLCDNNINNIIMAESTKDDTLVITTNDGITYSITIVDNNVTNILNLTENN